MKDEAKGVKETSDWSKADSPETVEEGRRLIESSPEASALYKTMVWAVGLKLEQAERLRAQGKRPSDISGSLIEYRKSLWDCYGYRIERLCDYSACVHCFINGRIGFALESIEGLLLG